MKFKVGDIIKPKVQLRNSYHSKIIAIDGECYITEMIYLKNNKKSSDKYSDKIETMDTHFEQVVLQ